MNKRTTGGALSVVLAATLLLSGCGSDDKKSDEIEGAGKESPSKSAEASPSTPADPKAPTFDFPGDVTVTVESESTGDKEKDAVLRDLGYASKAIKLALTKRDPDLAVFKEYVVSQAATDWRASVNNFKKSGHTVTGKIDFYDHKVEAGKGNRATVTYCEDQRYAYRKEVNTGKVIKTEPSKDSFIGHADMMQQGSDGIWRMISQFSEEGAAECQR